jgi:hypothetical protein
MAERSVLIVNWFIVLSKVIKSKAFRTVVSGFFVRIECSR